MKTSDNIIIEELRRVILMQTEEIAQLKAMNEVLKKELERYKTGKDSNNSSMPPSSPVRFRAIGPKT
ncbi:MAG TPA: hypothetical protein PK910_10220 [Bacteroidales bacterium]|nr:hypothetical protein [Bacteroidales bacterium]HCI54525.1 hypothetical protein [Bacteroidales bacterium]HQG37235.1 hypothetical protein [Bacteroidales bacterium]HRC90377.1 hypothetical protein [Bacteroidales bacterium]